MASFHPFPKLPCELRLEIWRLAIRPAGRGIHRFSIYNNHSDLPGASDRLVARHAAGAPRIPGERGHSWTTGNDSAYLWDAGLWTACWESRDVALRHFRVRHWDEVRRRLLRSAGQWTPAALAAEFEEVTATATARCGGRECHLMVQPHKDLFWLEPHDWQTTVEWPSLFADLPFASSRRGYGHLSHVAIEHDASWNVGVPKDLATLLREPTPRGFVARALAACATNKLYCFIWLVDGSLARRRLDEESDEATEVDTTEVDTTEVDTTGSDMKHAVEQATRDAIRDEMRDEREGEMDHDAQNRDDAQDSTEDDSDADLMTFYDCKGVYADTDRTDLVAHRYDVAGEFEKTALHFVQLLGTIGNADYSLLGDDGEGFDFSVDDYLGVLARA